MNLSKTPFQIVHTQRIAQLVFCLLAPVQFKIVDKLSETERGPKGFGSTGY